MSLSRYIYLYLMTVPVFFALDMIWLGFIAVDFYSTQLGDLLGPINWPVAFLFYFLNIAGIIIFAVTPAIKAHSRAKATILGALFGFFTYATYDLTNLATIKDWPLILSLVDMVWGTVLSSSVATVSYLMGNKLFK
jgi:uncharacterized membrane protein